MEGGNFHTLGALLVALIAAKTRIRDFCVAMLEAFYYVPNVAEVWRTLLFDASMDLHRLREVQFQLDRSAASLPVASHTLARANSIPAVLSEERIRAIKTLEDAYNLLSEYEFTNVQEVVDSVTGPFFPEAKERRPEVPGKAMDAQQRVASVREHLGSLQTFQFIHAIRCGAFPLAVGPRRSPT